MSKGKKNVNCIIVKTIHFNDCLCALCNQGRSKSLKTLNCLVPPRLEVVDIIDVDAIVDKLVFDHPGEYYTRVGHSYRIRSDFRRHSNRLRELEKYDVDSLKLLSPPPKKKLDFSNM